MAPSNIVANGGTTQGPPLDDYTYIVPLLAAQQYISMRGNEPGAQRDMMPRPLYDEYQAKVAAFQALVVSDDCGPQASLDIPGEIRGIVADVENSAIFQRTFNLGPAKIRYVDAGRLHVFQPFLNLKHVEDIKAQIAADSSPEAIARLALDLADRQPAVQVLPVSENGVIVVSPSNDLRPLGLKVLSADQLATTDASLISRLVGVAIGYTPNYLRAVEYNGNIYLHNGSHRAAALYASGIRYVPCVVQQPTPPEVQMILAQQFQGPRPGTQHRQPMLCDYFNPAITTVIKQVRSVKVVRVNVAFEESYTPMV